MKIESWGGYNKAVKMAYAIRKNRFIDRVKGKIKRTIKKLLKKRAKQFEEILYKE